MIEVGDFTTEKNGANRLSEVQYDSDGAGSGLALVSNYAFSASNNLLMSITGLEYYANSAWKKLTRTQGSGSNASTTLLVTDFVQQNPEWWYAGEVSIIKHSGFDGGESHNRSMEYDFDVAESCMSNHSQPGQE